MAKDYEAAPDEIHFALTRGVKNTNPDGSTVHFSRHPNSPDHIITVVTRGSKVMRAMVNYKPAKEVVSIRKQKEAEAKERQDRSAARQKEQLARKRSKTPPKPPNKK